jgi:hypothetical protein
MERVLAFIADIQWWIYGVLGLLLLFYLWRALVARRAGARSIFKLEQEQAQTRYRRNVTICTVILLVIAAVFVAGNPLLPGPSSTTPEPTPTQTTGPLAAATLTPTPPPPTITPTATPTKERPTRPPQPTTTPDVSGTMTPVVHPPACPDANVRITSPGTNQVVQGNFPIRGTANAPDFQYYKVEVGPGASPKDHEWTVIGQLHKTPVVGGVLETFNGGAYPPGTYTLRLVVVDNTGNYPEPCRVTVTVQH